jgi:hypothetical protein
MLAPFIPSKQQTAASKQTVTAWTVLQVQQQIRGEAKRWMSWFRMPPPQLIKEQNKQGVWAADQAIMAEYAAQLEKQEAAHLRPLQDATHTYTHITSSPTRDASRSCRSALREYSVCTGHNLAQLTSRCAA